MRTVLLCLLLSFSAQAADIVTQTKQMTLSGDWDGAIARLEPAIAGAKGDPVREAALRTELGRVLADRNFFHQSDPESARRTLESALSAAQRAHYRPAIADAIQYLGQLYFAEAFHTQDWRKPRALFLRAISLRRGLKDQSGLAQSYFYLGLTYEQQTPARKDLALRHYRHSLALSTAIGDKVLQSYAYRHIGGLREEAGDLDGALRDIDRSIQLRREGGFAVGLPYAMLQKADFLVQHYARRGESIDLLEHAVDLAEAAHSTRALSEVQLALGRLQMEKGDHAEAASFLECALDHAQDFGDPEAIRTIEQYLTNARLK
jgi:tetratricopeptide (TPR) repeat protein